mgnify:CR=1 FL=1
MKYILVLYILCSFCGKCSALSKNEVIWPLFDSPPSIILEGTNQGQGNVDLIMQFIQNTLRDYSHVNMVMNYERFFKFAQSNTITVCAIGVDKTPDRLKFLYYSVPTTIELAPAMIVRKDELKNFIAQQEVSLKETLNNTQLKGVFVAGNTYTSEADILIDTYKNKAHINIKNYRKAQLLELLMRKRIDYFLHPPSAINYLTMQLGKERIFASLVVKEIPSHTLGYTVCNKTLTGKRVIEEVSMLLRRKRSSLEYLDMLGKWQDKNSLQQILKIYHDDFLNQMN